MSNEQEAELRKAFNFIKQYGEREFLHNHDLTYCKEQMVKWANYGLQTLDMLSKSAAPVAAPPPDTKNSKP